MKYLRELQKPPVVRASRQREKGSSWREAQSKFRQVWRQRGKGRNSPPGLTKVKTPSEHARIRAGRLEREIVLTRRSRGFGTEQPEGRSGCRGWGRSRRRCGGRRAKREPAERRFFRGCLSRRIVFPLAARCGRGGGGAKQSASRCGGGRRLRGTEERGRWAGRPSWGGRTRRSGCGPAKETACRFRRGREQASAGGRGRSGSPSKERRSRPCLRCSRRRGGFRSAEREGRRATGRACSAKEPSSSGRVRSGRGRLTEQTRRRGCRRSRRGSRGYERVHSASGNTSRRGRHTAAGLTRLPEGESSSRAAKVECCSRQILLSACRRAMARGRTASLTHRWMKNELETIERNSRARTSLGFLAHADSRPRYARKHRLHFRRDARANRDSGLKNSIPAKRRRTRQAHSLPSSAPRRSTRLPSPHHLSRVQSL